MHFGISPTAAIAGAGAGEGGEGRPSDREGGTFFSKEVENLSPGWLWCNLLQGREVVCDVVHVQLRAGRQLHPRRDVQGGPGVLPVSAWNLLLLRLSRLVCVA